MVFRTDLRRRTICPTTFSISIRPAAPSSPRHAVTPCFELARQPQAVFRYASARSILVIRQPLPPFPHRGCSLSLAAPRFPATYLPLISLFQVPASLRL